MSGDLGLLRVREMGGAWGLGRWGLLRWVLTGGYGDG